MQILQRMDCLLPILENLLSNWVFHIHQCPLSLSKATAYLQKLPQTRRRNKNLAIHIFGLCFHFLGLGQIKVSRALWFLQYYPYGWHYQGTARIHFLCHRLWQSNWRGTSGISITKDVNLLFLQNSTNRTRNWIMCNFVVWVSHLLFDESQKPVSAMSWNVELLEDPLLLH